MRPRSQTRDGRIDGLGDIVIGVSIKRIRCTAVDRIRSDAVGRPGPAYPLDAGSVEVDNGIGAFDLEYRRRGGEVAVVFAPAVVGRVMADAPVETRIENRWIVVNDLIHKRGGGELSKCLPVHESGQAECHQKAKEGSSNAILPTGCHGFLSPKGDCS